MIIKYRGYSISRSFRGVGVPAGFTPKRLSACGTVGMEQLPDEPSEEAARAAIDRALDRKGNS